VKVVELWVYPVKSCRGIALPAARLLATGLAWDRHWMLVDAHGHAMTQREYPQLVRFETELLRDPLRIDDPSAEFEMLRVRAEGVPDFRASLTEWRKGRNIDAILFEKPVATTEHPEASAWFSKALQRAVHLVALRPETARAMNPKYARPADHVSLADGYPLTLASERSLAALNERLHARGAPPASMRNFRPNIVVDGDAPFCEDGWSRVSVGVSTLRLAKPTSRCTVVNVREDGSSHKDPLRTLASFRTRDNEAYFAVNLIPELGGEESVHLAVGDRVAPAL
jgi:uncharacterized protein